MFSEVCNFINLSIKKMLILKFLKTVNLTPSFSYHSHTTSSINGDVTQQNLDIQNPYIALNGFIYLGV